MDRKTQILALIKQLDLVKSKECRDSVCAAINQLAREQYEQTREVLVSGQWVKA